MMPERLRRTAGLQSVAQALGQHDGMPSREEAKYLGEASEARAIIGVLKKRLKSKTKEEAMLSQEVRTCDSKVEVLKNELMSEVKSKETITRDLEDEKSKLIDLRLRYTEKGKEEVQHLKKVHQLEIQLKDVTARLENKVEGERYAMLSRKEAKAKLAECENTIMKLKYDNASALSLLNAEKQNAASLKEELSRKQNQLMRENHANKIEIEGLQKVVLEKEATAAELQAEVREANDEVKALCDALELNTEKAEAMKSRLTRTLHSEADRVAALNADLNDKRRRESMLASDISNGEQRESIMNKQLAMSSRQETELNSALNDCRKQITNLEERLNLRNKENGKLQTTVEEIKGVCKLCEEKIEAVESEYRVIRSSCARSSSTCRTWRLACTRRRLLTRIGSTRSGPPRRTPRSWRIACRRRRRRSPRRRPSWRGRRRASRTWAASCGTSRTRRTASRASWRTSCARTRPPTRDSARASPTSSSSPTSLS